MGLKSSFSHKFVTKTEKVGKKEVSHEIGRTSSWRSKISDLRIFTNKPKRLIKCQTLPLSHFTVDVFAIFSPVFSLRIFYKKHAKNHTSNKPRAFKICVQLSFDKLIWYTKFHKDWSTRRQKHHWSKFFDGLVKYRTENRKTVHCVVVTKSADRISDVNCVQISWNMYCLVVVTKSADLIYQLRTNFVEHKHFYPHR